ncbi:MAG: SocA family protein [Mitsuaria chitosanitabida]|uniref:Panacea domain-containing protein n=1 Tax=Roseateles chitosanitabidus TaxID=65048 RepID=UPI001B2E49F6|nr:Panacea domain-containing protein [Roseateles chitosanitabidus]MBO9686009.1 SocA family protein [Roseateles chitosanitabidus]
MYSAYAIANAFIRRAQEGRLPHLNSMKLQKLMYFTQAWHLRVKGFPLIDDTFIRGANGPILPSIHHQAKRYGMRSITQTIQALSGDDDQDERWIPILQKDDASALDLVDVICERYGCLSWRELSALTHLPGSAWSQGQADDSPITNAQIRNAPTL